MSAIADNTTGIAVISLTIIVGGYLLVASLWYLMVYRPSRQRRAREQQQGKGSPHDPADSPQGGGPSAEG
ncbi:MAG: hypothetical protein ACR2NB_10250 [Solirubrobacteraceae bacterium]